MSKTAYDCIGVGYSEHPRANPRIAARIEAALGDAQTVLNVSAGTGPMSRLTATSVSSTSVSDVATHHSKRLMGFEATTFCMAMAKVTREPHPLYAYCGCFAAPGERHPDGK